MRAYLERYKNLREQVEALYARLVEDRPSYEVAECAIDLCRHSQPYQLIIAKTEPKGSLVETLDYIRKQIEDFRKQPAYESDSQFGVNDRRKVPEMFLANQSSIRGVDRQGRGQLQAADADRRSVSDHRVPPGPL